MKITHRLIAPIRSHALWRATHTAEYRDTRDATRPNRRRRRWCRFVPATAATAFAALGLGVVPMSAPAGAAEAVAAQPASFHVSGRSATSIATAWSPVAGATGYVLFRWSSQVGTAPTPTFDFTDLPCGQTERLSVSSVSASGARSPSTSLFASTQPCTATVHAGSPLETATLAVGTTNTQDSFYGNPTAVARVERLLGAVATFQNQHIYGWGTLNPEPAPGVFDFRSLDQRVAQITAMGSTPVLTLCCAPDWMTPLGTDTSTYSTLAPTPAHYRDFAQLVRTIALRYPQVRYYDVWNQMKGFWDPATGNWNYVAYTQMYNLVYETLKSVNPDIQVGGPYLALGDPASATSPMSAANLQVLKYWLQHKRGADFVSFTHAIVNWTATSVPPLATILASTNQFAEYEEQIHSLTTLPIWWAESYFDGKFTRITYADLAFQEVALASILYQQEMGGAAVNLRFMPQGYQGLPYDGCQESLVSDPSTAAGGRKLPNYVPYMIFHRDFPPGTPLVQTTSSTPDIEVMASKAHTLVINKRDASVTLTLNGTTTTLAPYEVTVT